MQYLKRILSWARPHRKLAMISIALVLGASTLAILMPVVITRVVIDGVIMAEPNAPLSFRIRRGRHRRSRMPLTTEKAVPVCRPSQDRLFSDSGDQFEA